MFDRRPLSTRSFRLSESTRDIDRFAAISTDSSLIIAKDVHLSHKISNHHIPSLENSMHDALFVNVSPPTPSNRIHVLDA